MCHAVSWIEKNKKIVFITDDDLRGRAGKEMRDYLSSKYWDDIKGHGAIRKLFDFSGGLEHECTDFSKPSNFPVAIRKAIYAGKFRQVWSDADLLTMEGISMWRKKRGRSRDEKVICNTFWDTFKIKKYRHPAWRRG